MIRNVTPPSGRVDSASKNCAVFSNLGKQNPVGKNDWASFKLLPDGVLHSFNAKMHDSTMTHSYLAQKKITDKSALKKVLGFFEKGKFELLNISDTQKVGKSTWVKTRNDFVSGLKKLVK